MFIGEYSHTIDAKKRISIPTKIRKELGDVAILTRGLDQCIFVYPEKEWEWIAEKLSKLPMGQADTRNFVRLMLAGAAEVGIDSLGRIIIPDNLKKYAELDAKAIIVGFFNGFGLWRLDGWARVQKKPKATQIGLPSGLEN